MTTPKTTGEKIIQAIPQDAHAYAVQGYMKSRNMLLEYRLHLNTSWLRYDEKHKLYTDEIAAIDQMVHDIINLATTAKEQAPK